MATLEDLTGQSAGNTDGISFLPELEGRKNDQKKHEFLYWEFGETGGSVAVRMGNWKGVKNNLVKDPKAKWQIFDLNKDIGEKNDIAAQHPEVAKKMEEIVKREHLNAHIKEWEFINPKFLK
jgi:arylsulfatase A-like enzyme